MGLKRHNQKPKSECLTQLHLAPIAQIKTCLVSIGGGGLMAESVYLLFNTIAAPVMLVGGATAIAFLGTVDFIEDKMISRALKKGHLKIKTYYRPKIEP